MTSHDDTHIDATTLPARVEVELACIQKTLGELNCLKKGSTIPLFVTPDDVFLVRVNGRPFARAELVDIDGQLGARLLSFV